MATSSTSKSKSWKAAICRFVPGQSRPRPWSRTLAAQRRRDLGAYPFAFDLAAVNDWSLWGRGRFLVEVGRAVRPEATIRPPPSEWARLSGLHSATYAVATTLVRGVRVKSRAVVRAPDDLDQVAVRVARHLRRAEGRAGHGLDDLERAQVLEPGFAAALTGIVLTMLASSGQFSIKGLGSFSTTSGPDGERGLTFVPDPIGIEILATLRRR